MLAAWARKKPRHEARARSGAGERPASEQHLAHRRRRHADAETLELADDPLVSPVRVLAGRRRISSRSERPIRGRPAFRCAYVQRRATSWRCQRSSVSGLTTRFARDVRGTARLSAANSARSARVSLGRPARRRSTARRRSRISSSFERRGRASNHTSANRFRAIRYANVQSKQTLPRPTARAPNLASRTRTKSRGRVCEPYARCVLTPRRRDRRAAANLAVDDTAFGACQEGSAQPD